MNAKQYLWCVKILRQAYKSKLNTKLPAIAVAAQAVFEAGYFAKGEPIDVLTGKRSFNLFGVKAIVKDGKIIAGGNNGYVSCYTHEEIKGKKELVLANFRAYKSYKDSFDDHAHILKVSKKNRKQRYRKAFEHLDNAEAFITEVWKAGYASDSNYLKNIIPLIRQLNRIPIWILKL